MGGRIVRHRNIGQTQRREAPGVFRYELSVLLEPMNDNTARIEDSVLRILARGTAKS